MFSALVYGFLFLALMPFCGRCDTRLRVLWPLFLIAMLFLALCR